MICFPLNFLTHLLYSLLSLSTPECTSEPFLFLEYYLHRDLHGSLPHLLWDFPQMLLLRRPLLTKLHHNHLFYLWSLFFSIAFIVISHVLLALSPQLE